MVMSEVIGKAAKIAAKADDLFPISETAEIIKAEMTVLRINLINNTSPVSFFSHEPPRPKNDEHKLVLSPPASKGGPFFVEQDFLDVAFCMDGSWQYQKRLTPVL